MTPITSGAICDSLCMKYEGTYPIIALFLFIMWGITIWLMIKGRREQMINSNNKDRQSVVGQRGN